MATRPADNATGANILAPARRYRNITKSDSEQDFVFRAFYVGGAGNLVLKGADGTQATFVCPAGVRIDAESSFVMNSTTATNVVGML